MDDTWRCKVVVVKKKEEAVVIKVEVALSHPRRLAVARAG